MLHIFDFARHMTLLAVAARMLTAVLCGGVVGLERELKRRPAGFRTHILICVGASMTILTNLYLYQVMHLYTDISRMGAQVIAGISFIGAGTIIVTKHRRVKGLTTAAGLWTVGVIGLVCGAGFLELALFVTLMVLFAEIFLSRLEYRYARLVKDVNLYVEYRGADTIQELLNLLEGRDVVVSNLEISRLPSEEEEEHHFCAILSLQSKHENLGEPLIRAIDALENVDTVAEM